MRGVKAKALRRAGRATGPGLHHGGHEHPGDCMAVYRVWTVARTGRKAEPYHVRCRVTGPHDLHRAGQREWR